MGELMLLQALGIVELLVALIAGEISLVHVDQLVTSEMISISKFFIAKAARKFDRTVVVNALMIVQCDVRLEPLRASGASEISLARVHTRHMVIQEPLVSKLFTAVRTSEIFNIQMDLVNMIRIRATIG